MLNRNLDAYIPYGITVLRISLGILYLAHSLIMKVGTFTVAGTMMYFEKIGYPGWLAVVTIIVEALGGLALVLGVQTRLVALILIPFMIGASGQHIHNGWMFTSTGGGWEFPIFWIATLVAMLGLGGGAFSVDAALQNAKPAGRVKTA